MLKTDEGLIAPRYFEYFFVTSLSKSPKGLRDLGAAIVKSAARYHMPVAHNSGKILYILRQLKCLFNLCVYYDM